VTPYRELIYGMLIYRKSIQNANSGEIEKLENSNMLFIK